MGLSQYRHVLAGLIGLVVFLVFVGVAFFESEPKEDEPLPHAPFVCHEVQNVSRSGVRSKHWECNDPDEHEVTEPYTYIYAPSIEHEKFVRMMEEQEQLQSKMCNGDKGLKAVVYTCGVDNCPGVSPQGMEGMLLSYLIAVLTKRAFLIHTPEWLTLTDYLTPVLELKKKGKQRSGVDWRIQKCKGALRRASEIRKVLYSPMDLRLPHGKGCLKGRRILEEEVALIGLMAEDEQQACAYELLKASHFSMPKWRFEPVYTRIFQERFKFSKAIRASADQFMLENKFQFDHKTICLNVETRAVPGRTSGAKHRNIEDFWRCGRWMERGADMANALHSSEFVKVPGNHSEYTWLITSDHEAVPESAERWLFRRGVYRRVISTVAAGYIRNSPDMRHIQLKHTFTELLVLSHCERYIGSFSPYSRMAASLYPKFDEKFYVQVEMEEINHKLPLSDICVRQRGGWGADLYDDEEADMV